MQPTNRCQQGRRREEVEETLRGSTEAILRVAPRTRFSPSLPFLSSFHLAPGGQGGEGGGVQQQQGLPEADPDPAQVAEELLRGSEDLQDGLDGGSRDTRGGQQAG